MSGYHNKHQKPDYIDRRQWKYDPMTGEPLIDGWQLYSGLPQREWQGLTDEEHIQIAIDAGCMSADWVFYGAAVERALKEKNA